MLAWSEGGNGRQKTQKSWLWRHCRRAICGADLQTCHAGKTQINRRRTLPASFPLVGCHRIWPERLLSESGRCGIAADWGVALYLWLIVVISVRQSTVAAISGLHCRALVMVSSSIRLTAWLQNSKKRAERSEDWCEQVTAIISSGYLHHRLPVMGC